VHVAKCEENFASVEHGDVVAEATVLAKAIEKFAATAVLEQHVDKDVVLEGGLQLINERVMQFAQDALLQLDVLHLLQVDYVGLADLLQRQYLLPRRHNLLHSPERASPQCRQHFVF